MNDEFVHLRVHSQYSIDQGVMKVEEIVNAAKTSKYSAISITDNNNLFGCLEFYQECLNKKIKPIIGTEVLLKNKYNPEKPYKLLLLIKNKLGYLNLSKLISKSVLYNEKNKNEFDLVWFKGSLSRGLIALSGAEYGNIGQALLKNKIKLAIKKANFWKKIFKNDFYLEIQRVKGKVDELYNNKVIYLSNKVKIPLVATHPILFEKKEDFISHEVRYCILKNNLLNSTKKSNFFYNQFFFSKEKMIKLFKDIPSSIINTVEISKKCNLDLNLYKIKIPFYKIDYINNNKFLINKSKKGLKKRLKKDFKESFKEKYIIYKNRLMKECKIIITMGFSDYFLIVYDFIKWIKKKKIPVGPGRGSGAGSLVAYCLNITNLDPIKYNLLFERFLNPERVSLPDFDIDICQIKREKVLNYVKKKYGIGSVSQIITFGKMAVKAALRDVGRILGYNYNFINKIVKMFPFKAIEDVLNIVKNNFLLKKRYNSEIEVRSLINLASKMEGLVRSLGVHAGGVIISPSKIFNFCPIYIQNNVIIIQFHKDNLEAIGLLKFDFLALTTLTIIADCIKSINKNYKSSKKLLHNISLNDELCFRNLRLANTTGVFQLESSGMKNMLKKAQVDSFENIIALISLYRPGPIKLLDKFCLRKTKKEEVSYLDQRLEGILKETYGIIVYQEQVILITQIIAGYSLAGADIFRKIISKKIFKEVSNQRAQFCKGAINNGLSFKNANIIFDLIKEFAGYGFNKSHATAYSLISYYTVWLKTYYVTEFMASNMSFSINDLEKLNFLIIDALKNGIIILPVDINKSNYNFIPLNNEIKKIRYGLGGIKGLGLNVVKSILKIRKKKLFLSFEDFCNRINKNIVNYKVVENLICSGAFDSLNLNRANLIKDLSSLFKKNSLVNLNNNFFLKKNQNLIFFWSYKIKCLEEKRVLNFSLLKNLYDIYYKKLKFFFKYKKILSGIIYKIEEKSFLNNKFYLIALQNNEEKFEVKVNNSLFLKHKNILQLNKLFLSISYFIEEKYNKKYYLVKNILSLKDLFILKKKNIFNFK